MGHRNSQFTGHMIDLETYPQGHNHLHPKPCIFYGSVANYPQHYIHPAAPSIGRGRTFNHHHLPEHHGSTFYGIPPCDGIHSQHPVVNLDLPVSASSSSHYNPYMTPPQTGITNFPVQKNNGTHDLFSPLSSQRIAVVPTDRYCRNMPYMDGVRGSFKRINVEGASANYQYHNDVADASSFVSPMTARPVESGVTSTDFTSFAPPEYGGNDPTSMVESGSYQSMRNIPDFQVHNASHMVQGNYVAPSVPLPGNPWFDMRFGANNGDICAFPWAQAPEPPFMHGKAGIYVARVETGNIGSQGYQVTNGNQGSNGFLHPTRPPVPQIHSNPHHPLPPVQSTSGYSINYPPQMSTSSARISTMNASNNGINPFPDVVDGRPSFLAPALPAGFHYLQPHRRGIILGSSARHHNLPHLRVLPEDEVSILETPGYHESGNSIDQHIDMRLDIDHMSYEELLALGEEIGSVGTGLHQDFILNNLKTRAFTSGHCVKLEDAQLMEDPVNFCVICQIDYMNGETIGTLDCKHEYHRECIKKWLLLKNSCPICKSTALHEEGKDKVFPDESSGLISDGVDELGDIGSRSSVIKMKGTSIDKFSSVDEEEKCEQMYGFLPCSYSATGHLFLILVYEYLLFHGESYVASGGERIFKILGPGVFGASAFQIIGSLPEALILLASGLLSSEELAEEYVFTGVGLLAGSTILLLTVIWGTCILLGSQNFRDPSHFNPSDKRSHSRLEKFLLSKWPGYGVVTDMGASVTARIVLISVIPSIIILIPEFFGLSLLGERVLVMITLFVSITFLLSYFFYQTMGKLLTENGSPSISTIRRIFNESDQDGDNLISFSELKEFLKEIKFRKLQSDEDSTVAEIMKDFDTDNDQRITMDEFILKPWISKKREEREMMSRLIPDILEHLQSSLYGSLLAEDGTPDVSALKRLFKEIDLDKDDCISSDELKQLMTNIKFGMIAYDAEIAASKIMEELDTSGDHLIDEEEFVRGLSRWLSTTYNPKLDSAKTEEDYYQKTWEQTDKLMEEKFIDKSPLAWIKALSLLVLGIVVLGLLAEPLIHSVRAFSKAVNLPSFYIAFMFVPLATNARLAISAITEARRKKLHTTSLTLSEIYGTVFMNNILGLAVLLSLIYYRGVSWDFSAEVFMVLVVSAIIGCLSSLSTVFPVWVSLLAYLLYPLSLVLVYVLGDSSWFS
ncbi:hypothetical protein F511_08556 [Dorcoceras hygrometricum]|uniref:Calcium-binding EF-hand family protein n=1 Tax=Dorcoceras hygrometricum TaxID=472368 RepID=A0A2Z7D487_9LAMI|nr:hypothetical protein F511_08556 [Dorcoceras hygrometricum]